MFKLLTANTKEKVLREYHLRRASVALMLIAILLVYICISLIPSIVLARTKKDSAVLFLSTAKVERMGEREALESWAEELNRDLGILVRPASEMLVYEGFREILQVKTSNIKINSFKFTNQPDGVVVKVAGVAKDRQSLLNFQDKLKTLANWDVTDLPVSSLTKDVDVGFEISLSPKTP